MSEAPPSIVTRARLVGAALIVAACIVAAVVAWSVRWEFYEPRPDDWLSDGWLLDSSGEPVYRVMPVYKTSPWVLGPKMAMFVVDENDQLLARAWRAPADWDTLNIVFLAHTPQQARLEIRAGLEGE